MNCTRPEYLIRGEKTRQIQAYYRRMMRDERISPEHVLSLRKEKDEVKRMRVIYFLKSIPGIGRKKAKRIMLDMQVNEETRLGELVAFQVEKLFENLRNFLQ